MIKGLSVDTTRPLPAPKPQQKTERAETSNFADQLIGAKSERPENPNRNDRKNSGRDTNREENRSAEREKDLQRTSDREVAKKSEGPEPGWRGLRQRRPGADATEADEVRKREKASDVKSERDERDDQKDDRDDRLSVNSATLPPAHASPSLPSSRSPASSDDEAPIVIENPKGSDSQELKLPDFFSKAALGQNGKAVAAKGSAAGETADLLASEKDTEGLTRQEAMEKFVAKMQSELGIPPEKLLKAFAQLDDKALQAPPEQSMGQLMKALDLSPKQEAKATALYEELLSTTGASLLNERVAGLDQGVNFDVMSPRDASLRKLNSSIDDLNKSFFRKGGAASEPKKAQAAVDSMDVELAKLMRSKTDGREVSEQSSQNGLGANAMMADAMKESVPGANGETGQATADLNATLAGLMASANPLTGAANSAGADGQMDLSFLGKEAGETSAKSVGGKSTLDSAFAKEMSKELKEQDVDLGEVETQSAGKSVDLANDPTAVLEGQTPIAGGAARPAMMGPSGMMLNRQATSQDEQDNVRELIKQAQIMIKRGGGEMKMEMKPEGMGAIQLRVNVENGQVNVQMLTESESAKHLLEKGLSELKSSLAAHELKVQSLSVDVGNDVKNQMDQKGSQEHAREQARQFASDFMGQFREERQGFRQGMLENNGWRSYNKQKSPDQLQPEAVARASAKSRSDDSKRLNLVA